MVLKGKNTTGVSPEKQKWYIRSMNVSAKSRVDTKAKWFNKRRKGGNCYEWEGLQRLTFIWLKVGQLLIDYYTVDQCQ